MPRCITQRTVGLFLGIALGALPLVGGAAPNDDAFTPALPTRDTLAPERRGGGGEANVSEQTGAATYSVAIELPPGRLGMAPSVALSYSSQNPLRGGIAVGWSLAAASTIERDPEVLDGSRYRAGDQRLVPSPDDPGAGEQYRAERDPGFARYEYDGDENA
jgi:hypothetical protein